jgi:hypothetical protein
MEAPRRFVFCRLRCFLLGFFPSIVTRRSDPLQPIVKHNINQL